MMACSSSRYSPQRVSDFSLRAASSLLASSLRRRPRAAVSPGNTGASWAHAGRAARRSAAIGTSGLTSGTSLSLGPARLLQQPADEENADARAGDRQGRLDVD